MSLRKSPAFTVLPISPGGIALAAGHSPAKPPQLAIICTRARALREKVVSLFPYPGRACMSIPASLIQAQPTAVTQVALHRGRATRACARGKSGRAVEQIGMEVGLASKHLTLVLQREDKQELERFGTQPTE
jgi:hypothetical protein